ncbi:MAG TPA: PIN domain-containing protein [Verrucomicrobiae bacterium]|nr:PIN domain-containing protein [Verrucomicrobiae bacterium]
MVYADTSCLLKVLRPDPLSKAVWTAILAEETVVVSTLAELETLAQLKAAWTGGLLARSEWRQAETRFNILKNQPPFEFRAPPAALFQTALRQHRNSGDVHCRSLDRLHLAAMEELDVSRLMTHDVNQANAAIEAGFQIISPGRG